jgi:hypothetical protein
MTPAEEQEYRGYFPNLNTRTAIVTDEAIPIYNCIAWTVGVTSQWLWPGSHINDFDLFYRRFGFGREAQGQVAAWGHSAAGMTHGCVSGPDHGPRWESKCGRGLRIQHGLNELVGASYGRVIAFYRRPSLQESRAAKLMLLLMEDRREFTEDEIALLREEINRLDPRLVQDFNKNFSFWKETWFKDRLAIDSDPTSRVGSFEFFRLLNMGDAIIPLVVNELIQPDNFIALQLYDRLQNEPRLLVEHSAEDDLILEGEQGRAHRTVRTYIRNR